MSHVEFNLKIMKKDGFDIPGYDELEKYFDYYEKRFLGGDPSPLRKKWYKEQIKNKEGTIEFKYHRADNLDNCGLYYMHGARIRATNVELSKIKNIDFHRFVAEQITAEIFKDVKGAVKSLILFTDSYKGSHDNYSFPSKFNYLVAFAPDYWKLIPETIISNPFHRHETVMYTGFAHYNETAIKKKPESRLKIQKMFSKYLDVLEGMRDETDAE